MNKRIKKGLLFVGALPVVIVLAVMVLLVWLETGHGIRTLLGVVNDTIPGTLSMTTLSLEPLKGRLRADGIELVSPAGERVILLPSLEVAVDLKELTRGRVTVRDITVTAPDIHLVITENGNLELTESLVPAPKDQTVDVSRETQPVVLPIIVERLSVVKGTLGFRDNVRKHVGKISDMTLSGTIDLTAPRAGLAFTADRIDFETGNGERVQADRLTASADLDSGSLKNIDIRLSTPMGDASLTGLIRNLRGIPEFDVSLKGRGDARKASGLLNTAPEIAGQVTADISFQGTLNDPRLKVSATVSSMTLFKETINAMDLDMILENRSLAVNRFTLDHNDAGSLTGQGSIDFTGVFPEGFLFPPGEIGRLGMDLAVRGGLTPGPILERFGIPGIKGKTDINARIKGFAAAPVAEILLSTRHGAFEPYPEFDMDIDLAMKNALARINRLSLATADSGSVDLTGTIDFKDLFSSLKRDGSLPLDSLAGDLGIRLANFVPEPFLAPLGIDGISGILNVNSSIKGRFSDPDAVLVITASEVSYPGYPTADASIDMSLSQGSVTVSSCEVMTTNSRIGFKGQARIMDKGTIRPVPSITVNIPMISGDVDLSELPIDGLPLKGRIVLNGSGRGTPIEPELDVVITGSDIEAYGESVSRLTIEAGFAGDRLTIGNAELILKPGQVLKGRGWVSPDKACFLKIDTDSVNLSSIAALQAGAPVEGRLFLDITCGGKIDNPDLEGNLKLTQLQILDRPLQDFYARVGLKQGKGTLKGRFNFDLESTLDLQSRNFSVDVTFDETDLTPWFSLARIPDIKGNMTGRIAAEGNAGAPETIRVNATVDDAGIVWKSDYLFKAKNIKGTLNNRDIMISPFSIELPGQGHLDLSAEGTIGKKIQAMAEGRIPAAAASLFTDDLHGLLGEISLKADVLIPSDPSETDIKGYLELHDLGLTLPGGDQKIHHVSGKITLAPDRIDIPGIQGKLDNGSFDVNGSVTVTDFMPDTADVTFTADRLPIDVPGSLEAVVSSRLALKGTRGKSRLKGSVTLESGVWSRDIHLEKSVLDSLTGKNRQRTHQPGTPSKNTEFLEAMTLDITVTGKQPFHVNNNLAYLEIRPDLLIIGNPLTPVITGLATLTPGTVTYQGKTFELTRGDINFINPYTIEPEIDLGAEHVIRDWTILLTASGTPDQLKLELSSTPSLEHADIVSLLVTGKTTDELIRSEGGSTTSPASMLAGIAATSAAGKIRENTGLDSLDVNYKSGGSSATDGLSVKAGKELTESMSVSYGIETKDSTVIQTTATHYKLTDTVTLSGFRDSEGNFGGEVRYRLEFK